MGWRGTLRSMQAAGRAVERGSRRLARELERRQKQLEKMEELERAAYEVEVYQNHMEVLVSLHKECGDSVDWQGIAASKPPPKPEPSREQEDTARSALQNYSPGVADRILRRTDKKVTLLRRQLDAAKRSDRKAFMDAMAQYQQDLADWEEQRAIAGRILQREEDAYVEAIQKLNPFSELSNLGSSIEFKTWDGDRIEAILHIKSEDAIPKETKSLLKSGRLSVKEMPKGKFCELYQDHVCSCILRVANETLSLLPVSMVIVTAVDELVDPATGHLEETPVVSVAVPRDTLYKLNLEQIDPSDSFRNFVHRMNFKKTSGLQPVEALRPTDLN